ncbi:MAG: hypothetical protein IJS90_06865 [Clostridia bacterium]|nr:hypothetical protein [Clostridia bacterium]
MKKAISVFLALVLSLGFVFAAVAENDAIEITNPYEGVNWDTVSQYKTALHSHTTVSDGSMNHVESLEKHMETGFDIVALTDHGNVDYSWVDGPDKNLINVAMKIKDNNQGDVKYLGSSGTFSNGVAYTVSEDENGDCFLRAENGRVILKMPYGIENNAVSVNAHVNSWFADYCDNSVTIYEDAVRGVEKAGGVCVINHPGEYTKARYELRTENAYDETNPAYAYYINKYAYLLENYDSLIGIDMNSKGDNRTRFDRKLWDILLTRFSANGENVFGICSSDAHNLGIIDSGFTFLLMDSLCSADARAALESGHFFGGSHCIGNYDELCDIAASLKEFYGEENETYLRVVRARDIIEERIEGIENGKYAPDEGIGEEYSLLQKDYEYIDTFPRVNQIVVDEAENTVELKNSDALIVRLISGGRLLDTKKAQDAVFDLDDYGSDIGNYVRFEVFGDGGIVYTQAFLINASSNAGTSKVVKGIYFNVGFLDFLFAELHRWFNVVVRWFTNLF